MSNKRTFHLAGDIVDTSVACVNEALAGGNEEYEALTGHDFDSQDELLEYLTNCSSQLEGWFP